MNCKLKEGLQMYGAFESEEEYEEYVKNGDWFIDTQSPDYWKKLIDDAKGDK